VQDGDVLVLPVSFQRDQLEVEFVASAKQVAGLWFLLHVYPSMLLRLFGWMLRQHPWTVTTVVNATGQPDHLMTQGTPRRCPRIGVTLSPSFHCFVFVVFILFPFRFL
jgi:hypothetical protein